MIETITPKEAAAILKKRLGFSAPASIIRSNATGRFSHLAVREFHRGGAGHATFIGINKSAWLNFLNGRNAARSAKELFSTEC